MEERVQMAKRTAPTIGPGVAQRSDDGLALVENSSRIVGKDTAYHGPNSHLVVPKNQRATVVAL
jgi:hypothetical protein